jgi:hypothetical protein
MAKKKIPEIHGFTKASFESINPIVYIRSVAQAHSVDQGQVAL